MGEPPLFDFTHHASVNDYAISTHDYLKARPNAAFSLMATGVLVFDTSNETKPRILLLQRAAHDSNPHKWEPPGGACDDDDKSILHAAARELWEETGLEASRFVGLVGQPYIFSLRSGKTVSRFYFLAQVNDFQSVKLDPNEHQNSLWVDEEEVRSGKANGVDLKITAPEVVQLILQGFSLIKTQ